MSPTLTIYSHEEIIKLKRKEVISLIHLIICMSHLLSFLFDC